MPEATPFFCGCDDALPFLLLATGARVVLLFPDPMGVSSESAVIRAFLK